MAQAINSPLYGHFITPPGNHFSVPDQTATSGAQELAYKARWFAAMIYQKAFTPGTGTARVLYRIEVADDSGFTSNVRTIANGTLARAAQEALFLVGFSPDNPKKYVRVGITEDGTDAATYDAIISAG